MALLFLSTTLFTFAFTVPGKPTGYVNDFASLFTIEQKNLLESKLALFNASTSNEIAVVTITSLEGDYIEHYAAELFKAWGIGNEKKDNGVLLLIALNDRAMRIEVGYGLEGSLTDSLSSQIIRNDLTPAFKKSEYYGGVDKALDNIILATKDEYQLDSTKKNASFPVSFETLFIIFIVVIQFFGSILARSKSWWAGGVLGAAAGIILTMISFLGVSLLIGGILTVILTLLGLLFDYVVSSKYTHSVQSGSPIPWWAGGGGSGGGRSFGGFGGGLSGGGGASGRW